MCVCLESCVSESVFIFWPFRDDALNELTPDKQTLLRCVFVNARHGGVYGGELILQHHACSLLGGTFHRNCNHRRWNLGTRGILIVQTHLHANEQSQHLYTHTRTYPQWPQLENRNTFMFFMLLSEQFNHV